MDAMIERSSTFEHAAAKFFVDTLMSDGWDRRGATQLLKKKDWKGRMQSAWCLLDAQEQAAAVAIDNDAYENYWPTLDFSRTRTSMVNVSDCITAIGVTQQCL
ncbi:hypothetical protein [Pseudomonas viridiflava]|uniref:hypothetical protein n=1 Tax=Pseudomonas viridiflava TaxID=33069 RepID=UPI0013CE470C|nr:hypothetical protein [Pseudomonas viridiflava]